MIEEKKNENVNDSESEQFDLNDDRRVKVLSPGALVRRRFFRNRVAVIGLVILVLMFLFSFVGGMLSPYSEDQLFYRTEYQKKAYASVVQNTEFRYLSTGDEFSSIVQAQMMLAITKNEETFVYRDKKYGVIKEGEDFYSCTYGGKKIGIAFKDVVSSSTEGAMDYDFEYNALLAYTNGEETFTSGGTEYTIDEEGNISSGSDTVAYIGRYVVKASMSDVFLTKDFKDKLL